MTSIITTEGLSKKYGSQFVLNDVSLNVKNKDIYGFLGENGAGKTTTIKLLSGLLISTSGKIIIDDMDMDIESNNIKKIIGLVPQDSSFYDSRNALSHMIYYGRLKGLTKKDALEQSNILLDKVGLKEAMKKNVGYFSHGMKKRLAIAQALLNKPKILILDEPTNGLDPAGTRQIKEILCEFNNNGITIVISSHNLLEIQEICNRVGIIHKGKIIAEDKIETIRHLESNGVVTVGVYNLSHKIINLIESLEFVVKTELKAENILDIFVNSMDDTKPEINKLIVENGGRVFKLVENSLSLEDAFFNITNSY
ncbi:Linearmycin resistance ATP-binding protein LnrL [Methanosarcinales archaeon]|nr:ABC transporter ATP-binding protein [Candidatus Methanoperedens sp. BLZ2]KAB2945915.1 MAG: ABC transporter ATP-binding protein [Candidatus Methanoperedens sp.]MBZ0174368.1 ABC transporter ATP-binding protein [Candidatus Methanoperedens nitroreducens]CAG0959886.1 Linearmycin resistance ATP-binding protein LnrL [Methanosarcinales archaeon]MCX9079901.1 ABC transporter ATP-binding protein [Candidatus Methanoperedens sp.]MCX9086337.1 ABC transporter ATP-binding protein [Candidatus Methanopereden